MPPLQLHPVFPFRRFVCETRWGLAEWNGTTPRNPVQMYRVCAETDAVNFRLGTVEEAREALGTPEESRAALSALEAILPSRAPVAAGAEAPTTPEPMPSLAPAEAAAEAPASPDLVPTPSTPPELVPSPPPSPVASEASTELTPTLAPESPEPVPSTSPSGAATELVPSLAPAPAATEPVLRLYSRLFGGGGGEEGGGAFKKHDISNQMNKPDTCDTHYNIRRFFKPGN